MLVVLVVGGCAARQATFRAAPAAAVAGAAATAPPPLDRSLFARDPDGQLSEDKLQAILDATIEIDLPARVGVIPIITAKDWRGPGPDYEDVPLATHAFVKQLRAGEKFTLVTQVMPIPSGALGMEALRETAARYKLRYLILYRERLVKRARPNGVAALYATGLGALFLAGHTLEVSGYIEASLFDVKTGLFMFTVRRDVSATTDDNIWRHDDKLLRLAARLAVKFAPDLARDLKIGRAHV